MKKKTQQHQRFQCQNSVRFAIVCVSKFNAIWLDWMFHLFSYSIIFPGQNFCTLFDAIDHQMNRWSGNVRIIIFHGINEQINQSKRFGFFPSSLMAQRAKSEGSRYSYRLQIFARWKSKYIYSLMIHIKCPERQFHSEMLQINVCSSIFNVAKCGSDWQFARFIIYGNVKRTTKFTQTSLILQIHRS